MFRVNFITVLGLVAAFFSTFAGVPQMLKAWRTRSTSDLSIGSLIMLWTGLVLWIVYAIGISSLPILAANIVGITIISLTLYFKIKYK